MKMLNTETCTATRADLFGHMEHLIAQLDTPPTARTARLTAAPTAKKARKLVEEATEVALDAVADNRAGLIAESVDLLYHLAVLWHDRGIDPKEIRAEMARRMSVLGIAEKLPKKGCARRKLSRARHSGSCALYREGNQIGPVALSRAFN
ncbi:MAG: phosphoribosyl-ATP diphosphatase [Rhodobacteraceae bacterium]|nr:phosphoribosyl-ATP diphosphatase [Paracoccaceae bacterium]